MTFCSASQPTTQGAYGPSSTWMDRTEHLAPERRPTRYGGHEDVEDMGELSDSPSSLPSHSRPATPSEAILISSDGTTSRRGSASAQGRNPIGGAASAEPLTLAHKAERILGLVPGTLPHARACLENARDEVRRTASASPSPMMPLHTAEGGGAGVLGKAAKAWNAITPSGKVPGVVLGLGGEEEEEKRERRRRAADGVLHWQREVARLEAEEQQQAALAAATVKRRR